MTSIHLINLHWCSIWISFHLTDCHFVRHKILRNILLTHTFKIADNWTLFKMKEFLMAGFLNNVHLLFSKKYITMNYVMSEKSYIIISWPHILRLFSFLMSSYKYLISLSCVSIKHEHLMSCCLWILIMYFFNKYLLCHRNSPRKTHLSCYSTPLPHSRCHFVDYWIRRNTSVPHT